MFGIPTEALGQDDVYTPDDRARACCRRTTLSSGYLVQLRHGARITCPDDAHTKWLGSVAYTARCSASARTRPPRPWTFAHLRFDVYALS